MNNFNKNRIDKIKFILDKNKGENIEIFDLQGSDYFTDFVIITTGLGDRHNEALLNYLKDDLKPKEEFLHIDISDGWVVIDLGDIIIHIMTDIYRENYKLETFLTEFQNRKKENIESFN
jgi:ribosome-associated protein